MFWLSTRAAPVVEPRGASRSASAALSLRRGRSLGRAAVGGDVCEGPVYVLVQFPTPFALGGEATVREGRPFLLSRDVAELVATAVGTEGAAYVSSQVEDVALASADALESAGLRLEPAEEPVTTEAPKRLRDVRALRRRAVPSRPWRATSPLPAEAAPESERRCELLGQPVRRFVASRRPRRGDRLRLFAAPRDDLDGRRRRRRCARRCPARGSCTRALTNS